MNGCRSDGDLGRCEGCRYSGLSLIDDVKMFN